NRRRPACFLAPVRAARDHQGRFARRWHQPRDPQHDRRERQGCAGRSQARATQQGQPTLAYRQHVQTRAGARFRAFRACNSGARRRDRIRLDPSRLRAARSGAARAAREFVRLARLCSFTRPDRAPSPQHRAALPPQCWRTVWRNPVNGRGALYLASHAYAIEGMEQTAAQELLAELMEAATAPALSYAHGWRKGDVVMWDNRATMHRGRPWPAREARLMVRTTISATEADGLESVRPPSRQAAE